MQKCVCYIFLELERALWAAKPLLREGWGGLEKGYRIDKQKEGFRDEQRGSRGWGAQTQTAYENVTVESMTF